MSRMYGGRLSRLNPAPQFPPHQCFQHRDAGITVVKAGYRGKLGAACGKELLLAADGQFLKRFQAISREARRGNGQPLGAFARLFGQHLISIGLQPFRPAEARLEAEFDTQLRKGGLQRLGKQERGLAALAMIGIAQMQRTFRHAVKTEQQHFRRE